MAGRDAATSNPLRVYRPEFQFVNWTADLIHELRKATAPLIRDICGQLDRASMSSLLRTAEGFDRRRRLPGESYFKDAGASANECTTCLDALVAQGTCSSDRVRQGKELLRQIQAMLSDLIQRITRTTAEGESAAGDFRREMDMDGTVGAKFEQKFLAVP